MKVNGELQPLQSTNCWEITPSNWPHSIFDLHELSHRNYTGALWYADSENEMRLAIKLRSSRPLASSLPDLSMVSL